MSRITGIGWLWFSFTLLLAIALAAVGTLSVTVWRLDQAEAEARRAAAVEENLRLALWRMDTALMPLLALENSRLPPDSENDPDLSELLSLTMETTRPPHAMPPEVAREWVQFRFELPLYGNKGVQTWPREHAPNDGEQTGDRPTHLPQSSPALADLRTTTDGNVVKDRQVVRPNGASARDWLLQLDREALALRLAPGTNSLNPPLTREIPEMDRMSQHSRAATEFNQRSQSLVLNNALIQNWNVDSSRISLPPNLLTPLWHEGQLLLARRMFGREVEAIQGTVVNWDMLQQWLLDSSRDLLPAATLEPVDLASAMGEPGLLAAIPARLVPGTLPANFSPRRSAAWPTLWLAWTGVATAVLASGLLLQGVFRLSQRRAAFVSAVTHELRTPLTTFQMYTEMLARDMVTDPAARREYLETLHGESLRLSHLVENVLAYARLERGRATARAELLSLEEIVTRPLPRLERRAAEVNMQLVIEEGPAWITSVRVDPSVVEQILWNLIDNACKYAVQSKDPRIVLSTVRRSHIVELRVRDFGPGLKPRWGRFQPFSKSVSEAAHSAPGIGLGLALSRRLAKQLGGKLFVDVTHKPGACFVLRLAT